MARKNMSVARVEAYGKGSISIRERHNERKNEAYANESVRTEMSHLNVHFKKPDSTYSQTLEKMIEENVVSVRGLREDAKIYNELVFDINSEYFEENGGYEYAKEFFEEVYHFAEKEMGSEYIISAVMHADEKNEGLSLLKGKDVYHYHLHVIALPVVEKEICNSKRCKDKELIGKVKEVIHQISHSKKWVYLPSLDEKGEPKLSKNGKPILIPSYSLLQDRFFEHMQNAGYKDFERGKKGSTAEHLTTTQYKVQQELLTHQMLREMNEDLRIEGSQLEQNISELKPIKEVFDDIDAVGKKTITGKIQLSEDEYEKLKSLAKEGITSRKVIEQQKDEISRLKTVFYKLKELYDNLVEEIKPYREALFVAPQKVKEFLKEIFSKPEKQEQNRWDISIQKPKKKDDFER